MKALLVSALLGTVVVAAGQVTDPRENFGSLFPQKGHQSWLATRTARSEGDIVTILISETSTASFSATTSAAKKDSTTVDRPVVPLLDFLGGSFLNKIVGSGASSGASSSVSGTGSTTQSGRFSTRLSAVVREVLPNGNLVIEGTRWVMVNKEVQSVVLTGIIRRDDVRSDNTVLSEDIANAEIRAEGKGVIADRQRRGFITRLLDWLF